MRYSLLFSAYPEATVSWTGEPCPDGVIPRNPLTKVEVLDRGAMQYELRLDDVPIGRLTAIVRDRYDELPPAFVQR